MKYYITCIKKYADLKGRARRAEYWYFYLFNFLIYMALYVLILVTGGTESYYSGTTGFGTGVFSILLYLYGLFVFLPGLAVGVRRLHDTSRSGWYLLVSLIPLAGAIWLLVMLVQDSTPGPNQYGPNPKEAA